MQLKMSLLPVLLLLGVSAAHACVTSKCPSPYEVCGYYDGCPVCCLPLATCAAPTIRTGLPSTSITLPQCCGGPGPACPLSVSCASSFSQAIAGANGCSTAASRIAGSSTSYSTSVFKTVFKQKIGEFCNLISESNVCSVELTDFNPPAYNYPTYLYKAVEAMASSYAQACVGVMAKWSQYACECGSCTTNACSSARTKVTGQFAAIATAQAAAFAGAWAEIQVCGTDPYGYPINMPVLAESWSTALASATAQAAIDVYDKLRTTQKDSCKYTYGSDSQKAIAEATACAFAKAFGDVFTSAYPTEWFEYTSPTYSASSISTKCLLDASTKVCASTQAHAFGCVAGTPGCYFTWGKTCDWRYLYACPLSK